MNRNRVLWGVQGVLALVFLFAGGMKLITPIEVLSVMSPFPGEFIRFIGVCEVLGAVGLILPYALRILPGLTALAGAGLVVIMGGATVTTLAIGGGVLALPTLLLGLLAALVAIGRRPSASRGEMTLPAVLQPAH
jgi:DoxX-like family